MKKMKKSALAAAVLLSLSMMGSAYAADYTTTETIFVNAGQTWDLSEQAGGPYTNVNITPTSGSGIVFTNADPLGAASYLNMITDGNVTIETIGENVIPICAGYVNGTYETHYSAKINLKAENIDITSDWVGVYLGGDNIANITANTLNISANEAHGAVWGRDGAHFSINTDLKEGEIPGVVTVNNCAGHGFMVSRGTEEKHTILDLNSSNLFLVTEGYGFSVGDYSEANINQNYFDGKIKITASGNNGINVYGNGHPTLLLDGDIDVQSSSSYGVRVGNAIFKVNRNVNNTNPGIVTLSGESISLRMEQSGGQAEIEGKEINFRSNCSNVGGVRGLMTIEGSELSIFGSHAKGVDSVVNITRKSDISQSDEVRNNGILNIDGNGNTLTWNSGAISGAGTTNIIGNVVMHVPSIGNQVNVGVAKDDSKGIEAKAGNLTFDMIDGTSSTLALSNTLNVVNGTVSLNVDLDLSDGDNISGDRMTIANLVQDTTISLSKINVLVDAGAGYSNKTYQLIGVEGTGQLTIGGTKVATDKAIYTIADGGSGNINVDAKVVSPGEILAEAIADGEVSKVEITEDKQVTKDLGTLADPDTPEGAKRELTIDGNGNEIDGKGKSGVTVTDGQVLNLINLTMNGFSGNAVTNGGTLNTQGDFRADKVANNGTMNVDGVANIDELAMGDGATVKVDGQLYSDTVTAIGSNNTMGAEHTYALGENNEVMGTKSVSVGYGNKVYGEGSGAFGDPNEVYGDGSYAVGNNNKIGTKETPVNNSFALGNSTTVSGNGSVALGNGSTATEDNVVSVGSETQQRKIVNVADGEAPTDAATVGQVSSVAGNLQSEINTLNGQIDHMGTRINKVGAGAAALAAMHPVYDEDSKLTFSAGLGAYRNEKAAAVGMFFRFSPRVMLNAGATVGNDNNMYNVGLNFALDRHVRGGLPSKAVMAKQLTAQSAEIADLKTQMAQQKADHDAQIAKLLALIEELKNK